MVFPWWSTLIVTVTTEAVSEEAATSDNWRELKGNQTVPKDNSPRSFIAIHERCEVVEKHLQFRVGSMELCDKSRAQCGEDCVKRHQDRVALGNILTRPYKMERAAAPPSATASIPS